MNQIIVAVIGVIAGFLTAFLAEPLKIYFQRRARLGELRIGLYKELWENYAWFISILGESDKAKPSIEKDLETDVFTLRLVEVDKTL